MGGTGKAISGKDLWLQRWLPLLAQRAAGATILEIGCGSGQDSSVLAGAVVASLSLHYFSWQETLALAQRVRETLRPGGILLCRLNSTNDHHYGASGHPEIEPHYYMVEGEPKRFFDRADVERMFATGWRMLALEETTFRRYEHPKTAWEAVLEPA